MPSAGRRAQRPRSWPGHSELAAAILDNLCFEQGRLPALASRNDWYLPVAQTVRELLLRRWIDTLQRLESSPRVVAYLSAEFLTGSHQENHLVNRHLWRSASSTTCQRAS